MQTKNPLDSVTQIFLKLYCLGVDVDGKVPLLEALIARDTATVKLLWENGATLKNADMGLYLGQAVLDCNKELINDYIKYGADINRYQIFFYTNDKIKSIFFTPMRETVMCMY